MEGSDGGIIKLDGSLPRCGLPSDAALKCASRLATRSERCLFQMVKSQPRGTVACHAGAKGMLLLQWTTALAFLILSWAS